MWNSGPQHKSDSNSQCVWLYVAVRFIVYVSVHLTSCKLYSLYSHAASALGILILIRPPKGETTLRISQSLIGHVFNSVYFRQKAWQ